MSLLDQIERLGSKLPEPPILFCWLAFFVVLGSALGAAVVTPARLLTPVIVFLGANSSVAGDAGYVIMPPLAAALYLAAGRRPVAGLAAAFCGVAGGFGGGAHARASGRVGTVRGDVVGRSKANR